MLITREYFLPSDLSGAFDKRMHVFVFVAGPYNETGRLRTHHRRKHVWSMCGYGHKSMVCGHRSHQVERWCRLSGAKPRITVDCNV